MANLILTQHVNNENETVRYQHPDTPLLISNIFNRAERTPGAVAVSEPRMMEGGACLPGDSPSPPQVSSEDSQTNSSLTPDEKIKHSCGTYALIAQCESGNHTFAKRVYCCKEWCVICGAEKSAAHNRRISRVLRKAMQIHSMGYFVIEWPDALRHIGSKGVNPDADDIIGGVYSKEALQDTSKTIVDVLAGKRMGRRGRVDGFFKRGLLRWHWFGDENPGHYNPHANVLVDSGFIEADKLEEIKHALRTALNVPDLIVHYSFVDTPGQMFQKVRYITRATFKNYDWSPYMANQLFNFRNQRWWGSWKDEPAWGSNDVEDSDIDGLLAVNKLQAGTCPDCGMPLKTLYHSKLDGHPVKWTRPVDSTWLIIWNAEEIAGTGYYRIPENEWDGNSLSPCEHIRLQELEREAKEKPSVSQAVLLVRNRINRYKASKENESWWNDILENPDEHM